MGIVVDLIIVTVLVLFTFIGYKKGLTGSLIKLFSFFIALVLAFALYKPVANLVTEKTQIDDNIQQSIVSTFSKEDNENKTEEQNMPKSLSETINEQIDNATTEARNTIVENTARETTKTIINIGSGIAIFIAVKIILLIIRLFAKEITKLPLIKQVDKAGGIVYGAVEGLFIIYIVLSIISLTSVMWSNNTVITAIGKSNLGETLYNNNLILNLLIK